MTSRRVGAAIAALVAGTGLFALPGPARAYTRYTAADGGVTFGWPQSCVFVTSYPANFSMMPLEEVTAAAEGAAAAWSGSDAEPCTYLKITMTSSTAKMPLAVNDHRNSLIFRVANWCELLDDGSCSPDIGAYEQAALAVTSVVANRATGEIRDADIEINAFHHHWADLVAHPDLFITDPSLQDLQNALTHEMGHLVGLDHTCVGADVTNPPLANNGLPVPRCNVASKEVEATTMFPSAVPGDTQKRTLAPDDQQAVCDMYPAASDPNKCSMTEDDPGCGCAAGRGTTSVGLLLALGLLWASLRHERGRRRPGGEV